MNYAVLLASGRGLRLKSNTIKPLLMLQGKPLFLYALDTFINNKHIDHIVLVVLPSCIKQFQAYLNSPKYKNVYLVHGDEQYRHQSLINAMSFLKTKFKMKPKDVIVSHDIARINVSASIIDDNIRVASDTGYASTVLPIHDSLCEINKTTKYITRDHKFSVQTPQSFQYRYWKWHAQSEHVTDLFTYLNIPVKQINIVIGDLLNFKITTKEDVSTWKQIQRL